MKLNPAPKNTLRSSYLDAVFFSIMIGFGESFFIPFALENQVSASLSGILASGPMLTGSVLQFLFYRKLSRLRNQRSALLTFVGIQVASLVALGLLGQMFSGSGLFRAMFAVITVYWFCTFSAGPIWNVWITKVIPQTSVAKFFSNRLALSQISLFLSYTLAGIILNHLIGRGKEVYLILFAVAGLARSLSGVFLGRLPTGGVADIREGIETEDVIHNKPILSLMIFAFCFYLGVWISAPYFTVFMLHHLRLSYLEFTMVTGTLIVSRFVFNNFQYRFLLKFGFLKTIVVGLALVVWSPALWLVSPNIIYLCALQIVGGIGWGIIDLAINIHIIENWGETSRSRVLSWYNLVTTSGMGIGAFIGAKILDMTDQSGFAVLFITSSLCRVAASSLAWQVSGKRFSYQEFRMRLVAFRPGSGPWYKLILSSASREEETSGQGEDS